MSSRDIFFIDHAAALGGAERSLLLLIKHLREGPWVSHVITVDGLLAERARDLGTPVHTVRLPRLRGSARAVPDLVHTAKQIATIGRSSPRCCLVANTTRSVAYAAWAAKRVDAPFIWYRRDFWLSESQPTWPWGDTLGKLLFCTVADAVVANSHATARHLPCRTKVRVIHNGIEIPPHEPASEANTLRRRFGIADQAPLIGMVGRLRPWKGQARFLRVLKKVREGLPNAKGLIAGGSPLQGSDSYRDYLRSLAEQLNLQNDIVFAGHLDDPRPAYAAMDIFVHPGDPEPFGLVNIEAMAMGKPVVAFAHGAIPEIVVDGKTGILVPPDDEAAMAAVLIDLLRNRTRAIQMGLEGRRRAESHFTIEKTASEFGALLTEILT